MRPLNLIVRRPRMRSEIDVSAEFTRRRTATWRATRLWLLMAALAAAGFALGPKGSDADMSRNQFTFMVICLLVVGTAMVVVILAVQKHYRCPRCDSVPMTRFGTVGTAGLSLKSWVDLSPEVCPNCGARLRPSSP